MKIKEGDKLPLADFFYLDDGNIVKKIDTNKARSRRRRKSSLFNTNFKKSIQIKQEAAGGGNHLF